MTKVMVAYCHDPADLGLIELAVTRTSPTESDWTPAYRDTVDGKLVVWARFDSTDGRVWLRDSEGTRYAVQM